MEPSVEIILQSKTQSKTDSASGYIFIFFFRSVGDMDNLILKLFKVWHC